MNYKMLLAELANKEELSIEKFCNLSAYKELEKNAGLIKKIQEYHLPEINRLICTSNKLVNEPWAKYYNMVKDIIFNETNIKSEEMIKALEFILDRCYKEDDFDSIIALEDDIVISSFYMYFEKMKNKKNKSIDLAEEIENVMKLRNEKSSKGQINDEQIKILLGKYKDKSDDELNALYEKYKNDILTYESDLKRNIDYINAVNKIRKGEIDFDKRRKEVYNIAKEIVVPDAGMFIRTFVKNGKIDKGYVDLLKKDNFILEIYEYLNKQPQIICPVIEHLADDGLVNIDSKDCKKLLVSIPDEYVLSYLFDDYKENKCICRNRVISSLWNVVIKKEIKSDSVIFYDLWAVVSDERSWNYIIKKIKEYDEINFHKKIIKFMSEDNFRSPEIIANIISTNIDIDFREKLWDICEELLLDNKNKHNFIMAIHDELRRKDQRRKQIIIEQEAENRRIIQSLFGEIYQPIEKLERFVYNLRKGDITYSKNLVLSEVSDSLVELRYGLSAIGLSPLEDEELWRKQTKIKFDSKKHNINSEAKGIPNEVLLKTIGFTYCDEDGDKKYHKAEVDVVDKDNIKAASCKRNGVNVNASKKVTNGNKKNSLKSNTENWYDPVAPKHSKK